VKVPGEENAGDRRAREGDGGEREQERQAARQSDQKELDPRTPSHDELTEDTGVQVAGARSGADHDRGDEPERQEDIDAATEVVDPARRVVLGRIDRVERGEDRVRNQLRADHEGDRRPEESPAFPQLQDLGRDQPRPGTRPPPRPRELPGRRRAHGPPFGP